MFPYGKTIRTLLTAGLLFLLGESRVFAGWMALKNETETGLVIQETVLVNGQPKPGPLRPIAANEAIRDEQVGPGVVRVITFYNSKNLDKPICTLKLDAPGANENFLYTIKGVGKDGLIIDCQKGQVVAAKNPPMGTLIKTGGTNDLKDKTPVTNTKGPGKDTPTIPMPPKTPTIPKKN